MISTLDKNQALRKTDLFAGLPFDELTAISRIASSAPFPMGAVIFRQGDPGNCLYVVLEGSVSIVMETAAGAEPLADVRPPGYFGEMAILDEKPRSATALVSSPALLLCIGKSEFQNLLRRHPDLCLSLLHSLSERIRLLQREGRAGG